MQDVREQKAPDTSYLDLPEIDLVDRGQWSKLANANIINLYTHATTLFAEKWARIMQSKISRGENLESIAEQSAYEADKRAISGMMYGRAVHMLSKTWRHGWRLQEWYNLTYKKCDIELDPRVFILGED